MKRGPYGNYAPCHKPKYPREWQLVQFCAISHSVCQKFNCFGFDLSPHFKVIHEHGLRYRGPDCQVGKPDEKALVFRVTGGFSTSVNLGK